ncbi:hypothetical protein TCAL_02185 [Tigriopus californicus]|uniref:Winged helix-turn-helix domain-containing protein n=1 Tax=Tigriopus californicus TaxID=6832 RepID=A0A553NUP9_TIGCA|nr:hypothetical protein TCAL_02185 [Tigriopus californicus]
MASSGEEHIVMTPKKKTAKSTTLMMERKLIQAKTGGKVHIAGGSNAGIVVNKESAIDDSKINPPQLSLEFRVFLINVQTKRYTQEKRVIAYWFKETYPEEQRAFSAQEFFKTLVSPTDFPRDYVGFIKKIMKLMQHEYSMLAKIEVELTQEKEMDELPNRPVLDEERGSDVPKKEVTAEDILEIIEDSYPNSLTVDDMSRRFVVEKELVKRMVMELVSKQLVKAVGVGGPSVEGVDSSVGAYRRVHQDEDQVTVVKQMPRIVEKSLQPTIAIITSQYHEKMAVDAVLTNKQTFVRYATVGEANVYTLGDLGSHRVVTTKLPLIGNGKDALIATGSTTTRLLGTFQRVEHVFLVGVGGAVPHYTDFDKHVRKGDVVIATPVSSQDRSIYKHSDVIFCKNGDIKFETKSWCPPDLGIQDLAQGLAKKFEANPSEAPWLGYYRSAQQHLESEMGGDWTRPSAETDKLYMSVGGGDVIEVGHPPPKGQVEDPRVYGEPLLHFGSVASGKKISLDDQLRQEFAARFGTLCFDTELDAVVESIYGNRKDQYVLIRGITDYKDGTREREWQNYSSLMAAAVLRAIVEQMDGPPS